MLKQLPNIATKSQDISHNFMDIITNVFIHMCHISVSLVKILSFTFMFDVCIILLGNASRKLN